jgi:hypothetical protein
MLNVTTFPRISVWERHSHASAVKYLFNIQSFSKFSRKRFPFVLKVTKHVYRRFSQCEILTTSERILKSKHASAVCLQGEKVPHRVRAVLHL